MVLPAAEVLNPTSFKLRRARAAAEQVAQLSSQQKDAILRRLAAVLRLNQPAIIEANRRDLSAEALSTAARDRLLLNPERIELIARSVEAVAELPDPIGQCVEAWTRPNGLRIRKVRVPLGVVGVIYESRPNVTIDAAILAFKAGNAVVLRGGREATSTNEALVELLQNVPGLPEGSVELLDSRTRDSVAALLRARRSVDVLVPRGGAQLINYVIENSTVPVIETGAGNCHVFVDKAADFDMADSIVINAKTQRPSVCNAAEKLLVHAGIAERYVPRIVERLRAAGVEIHGDERTRRLASDSVHPATADDWVTEYLDLRIAVAVVSGLDAAIEHINQYSTHHSEAIITADESRARRFLQGVDSAAVYWNASTRFTDGGEFGFGAEMGISTQKLHCRGPFALNELTSLKYEVIGTGQVRT